MEDWKAAFAEEWDAVVLGTGLKECLLSGLLSVAGKKVLHLDRNDYYGGASASLDIQQLFSKFDIKEKPTEAELGKLRDYAVDMVPKFIMACGQLVKVLIHTGVHNYMEFKAVDGSFVYSSKAGKICKVPATPEDAMKSVRTCGGVEPRLAAPTPARRTGCLAERYRRPAPRRT